MSTLATLWYPNPSPIGATSVVALAIGSVLAFGIGRLSPLSRAKRRAVAAVAPWVLIGLCGLTEDSTLSHLWCPGRVFPDGEDYAAAIVYLAFGFGCAPANFRFHAPIHRFTAVALTTLNGCVIVWQAMQDLPADARVQPPIATALFAVGWSVIAGVLYRRSVEQWRWDQQGRCPGCGYDLRATPDRCPECGHASSAA